MEWARCSTASARGRGGGHRLLDDCVEAGRTEPDALSRDSFRPPVEAGHLRRLLLPILLVETELWLLRGFREPLGGA